MLILLAAAPDVAVLSTRPGDGFSELRFQRVGATELSSPVARFDHLDDATALGALIPNTRKVVATATVQKGDTSFASALVLLEANQPNRVLADQCAVANRPLVTPNGRIFIQRGVAGPERIDTLRIDEIRLDKEPRTIFTTEGFTAFIAGFAGNELLIYRVAREGAELLAVNIDTLAQRTLTRIEPLARDFVVDEHRALFTLGNSQTRSWHVVSVELRTGELTTLGTGRLPALLPFVLDGKVVFNTGEGPSFQHHRFVTRDGIRLGLTETPSDFSTPFALDARGKRLELVTVPGARLDLAGVAP